MKWELFEINEEYVESYGREKAISVFYPVDPYYTLPPKFEIRKSEFDSPEEAEQYIKENKEQFRSSSIYYCIPKIEVK